MTSRRQPAKTLEDRASSVLTSGKITPDMKELLTSIDTASTRMFTSHGEGFVDLMFAEPNGWQAKLGDPEFMMGEPSGRTRATAGFLSDLNLIEHDSANHMNSDGGFNEYAKLTDLGKYVLKVWKLPNRWNHLL